MKQASITRRFPAALALLCAALWVLAPAALAVQSGESPERFWRPLDNVTFDTFGLSSLQDRGPRLPREGKGQFYRLNVDRLRRALGVPDPRERARAGGGLSSAPSAPAPQAPATVIWLPLPNKTYARFAVEESPIMEPELAAQFPSIRSFRGQGVDDPTMTVRFNLTDAGLYGVVLSPDRTYYIDPTPRRRGDDETHLTAFRHDYPPDPSRMTCNVTQEEEAAARPPADAARRSGDAARQAALSNGETLRTYRLAVAATGEYTRYHGGVDGAFLAISNTIARVNGIYERDLAIRLVLVNRQRSIIYPDPARDPYTNGDDRLMLSENQSNLDQPRPVGPIGEGNYDIGHVFGVGSGGRASRGVGRNGLKARGMTGSNDPRGDAFDVDYVAHEMGHQFGARHTFNGTTDNCGRGNRVADTAYEPGSGSTIMAYAGICGASENLQENSDDYFHAASLEEIITYVTSEEVRNVPGLTPTNNRPPTLSTAQTFTVPKGTPFVLTAAGTDADNDTLTYVWEQFDLGDPSPPDDDLAVSRPIFRSMKPSRETARVFPRMPFLLGDDVKPGERLSSRSRALTFRATVRDNRARGGGVSFAGATVNVITDAGPFVVNQPAQGAAWRRGSEQTVEWDPAGTRLAPLSVERVRITLSDDGGANFRHVLAADAPNDGTFRFTVPGSIPATDRARVRVEGVGNIFFNVSPGYFRVVN